MFGFFDDDKPNPIRFLCDSKVENAIPKPYPAKKLIPDWYKSLKPFHESNDTFVPTPTLKRCPPFLDAMSAGWIIPLAAEIHFEVIDQGTGVNWKYDFPYPMVEAHKLKQIETHPKYPMVPLKFLNHWLIQTPPGWSTLFVAPLNRPDDKLELLSGIVETDKYFEYVNFPGFIKVTDHSYLHLPVGYPLMQAIPFKRNYNQDAIIDILNEKDLKELELTRLKRSGNSSLYRETMWEKK